MKIICEHGYYKFFPEIANEIAIFENVFNRKLVAVGDYYTFAKLAELQNYSIEGQDYGGIPAKVNYAGRIEDVFYQNQLKYNIEDDTIESNDKLAIVGERTDNYSWVVTGIPQAYGQLSDKTVISGFQGFVQEYRRHTDNCQIKRSFQDFKGLSMSCIIIRRSAGGKMRIFEAILTSGKVYINNGTVEVPNVKILSEGAGDSEGIMLLQGSECIYIAETAGDLKKGLQIIADGFGTLSGDVIKATGGTTDTGGASPTFETDMKQVQQDLNDLIGGLK